MRNTVFSHGLLLARWAYAGTIDRRRDAKRMMKAAELIKQRETVIEDR